MSSGSGKDDWPGKSWQTTGSGKSRRLPSQWILVLCYRRQSRRGRWSFVSCPAIRSTHFVSRAHQRQNHEPFDGANLRLENRNFTEAWSMERQLREHIVLMRFLGLVKYIASHPRGLGESAICPSSCSLLSSPKRSCDAQPM